MFSLMITAGQVFIYRSKPKYRIMADEQTKCVLSSQPLVTNVSVTTAVCWFSITTTSLMVLHGANVSDTLTVIMVVLITPLSSALYPLFYWWNHVNDKQQQQKEQRVLQAVKAKVHFVKC